MMVYDSPLKVGESFCTSSKAVVCMLLKWLLAMVQLDFGLPLMESLLSHVNNADGYTKQQIFLTLCPKPHSPKINRRYMKLWKAETKINAEKASVLLI